MHRNLRCVNTLPIAKSLRPVVMAAAAAVAVAINASFLVAKIIL
jgi:hypothetical protein